MMNSRGVSVVVQLINPTALSGGGMQEMALPVALHSPLTIFKEQLASCTGISPGEQVLILCDLSDPDRNSDVHLDSAYDNMSLRDCGFKNGSVFTLHALGISAERAQKLQAEAQARKAEAEMASELSNRDSRMLRTPVTAARADHSFNGIIFDLRSRDAHEIEVLSISLGGMLGRVRIFARNCRWEKDIPPDYNDNYWGHHPGVSQEGWELVVDQNMLPSWERHVELWFNKPFKIQPHGRHAFYCHSNLPDDLGIHYQSCRGRDAVTVQDEHLQILPGLGHCGSTPFGNRNTDGGWYRSYRTLAGTVRYRSRLKGWNMKEHTIFPSALRQAVVTMLRAQKVKPKPLPGSRSLPGSPRKPNEASARPILKRASSAPAEMDGDDDDAVKMSQADSEDEGEGEGQGQMDEEGEEVVPGIPLSPTTEGAIGVLHERHLMRNIMEFCHYDWFKEVEAQRRAAGKGKSRREAAAGGGDSDSDSEGDGDDEDGDRMFGGGAARNIMQRLRSAIAGANGGQVAIDVEDFLRMIAAQQGEEDEDEYEDEDEDEDEDSSGGAAGGNSHGMTLRSRGRVGGGWASIFGGARPGSARPGQGQSGFSDDEEEQDDDDESMDEEEGNAFFDAFEGAEEEEEEEENDDESSAGEDEHAFFDAETPAAAWTRRHGEEGDGEEEQDQEQDQAQDAPSPGTRTRAALESIARRIPNSFTIASESPGAAAASVEEDSEDEG